MNNLRPLSQETIEESSALVQSTFRSYRSRILDHAGNIAFTDKYDGSPVTEMDIEVEKALQTAMQREFPDLPVIGEETGYEDRNFPPHCWLVDPIDGTKAFIENKPTFTSMAALILNDEAIAAVIYNPSTDDMYVAQKGRGTYKNGQRIDLAATTLPKVAMSKRQFIPALDILLQSAGVTCEPAPSGGGYGFITVLEGRNAARLNLKSRGSTHDYAPGGLLIQEANGVIVPVLEDDGSDATEYTFRSKCFVTCHPALAPFILEHTEEIRELERQSRSNNTTDSGSKHD